MKDAKTFNAKMPSSKDAKFQISFCVFASLHLCV